MPTPEGYWTPEEFESAFKTFGNLLLALNAVYRESGLVTPENMVRGGSRLLHHIRAQTNEQLLEIALFVRTINILRPGLMNLIADEVARRELHFDMG